MIIQYSIKYETAKRVQEPKPTALLINQSQIATFVPCRDMPINTSFRDHSGLSEAEPVKLTLNKELYLKLG